MGAHMNASHNHRPERRGEVGCALAEYCEGKKQEGLFHLSIRVLFTDHPANLWNQNSLSMSPALHFENAMSTGATCIIDECMVVMNVKVPSAMDAGAGLGPPNLLGIANCIMMQTAV